MRLNKSRYKTQSTDQALDRVFMALADGTRRALVHRIAQGEFTVSELAEPFEMSLAAVSKHLKVLEEAGLISRRVDGRSHFLSLCPEKLTGALDWISVYRNFWNQRLDQLDQLVNDSAPSSSPTRKEPCS